MNPIAKIRHLAIYSESKWEMAVDTCVDPDNRPLPERRERAMLDQERAERAWEEAIDAIESGAWHLAVPALERAQGLAKDWGDSSDEDKALAIVRAQLEARAPGGAS